ncbi:hypothetical protein WA016_02911 [Myxococcus stipitatus]
MALLSVMAPGIGIPQDEQALLFERYFRARRVSARSQGGLCISRDTPADAPSTEAPPPLVSKELQPRLSTTRHPVGFSAWIHTLRALA